MICEGDQIWMTGATCNALFYLDFNTKMYEFISAFPNIPVMGYRSNLVCTKIEDELFFFPDRCECFFIYHTVSKTFSKIVFNYPE